MLEADDVKALNSAFPRAAHEFMQGLVYITEQAVTDRIEEVDPAWQFELLRIEHVFDQAIVHARLTIKGVSRDGVGMQKVNEKAGEAAKGAATDALKRAARLFGVGRYLLDNPPKEGPAFDTWLAAQQKALNAQQAPEHTETPPAPQQPTPPPSAPQNATQGQERPMPVSDLNGSIGAGAQGGFDELFPPQIGGAKVVTLDNGKQVHRALKLSTEPVPGRDVAGFPVIGGGKINMIDLLNKALAEKLVNEKNHFSNQIDLCIKEGRISDLEKVTAEAVLDAMRAHVAAKDLQREGAGR